MRAMLGSGILVLPVLAMATTGFRLRVMNPGLAGFGIPETWKRYFSCALSTRDVKFTRLRGSSEEAL